MSRCYINVLCRFNLGCASTGKWISLNQGYVYEGTIVSPFFLLKWWNGQIFKAFNKTQFKNNWDFI